MSIGARAARGASAHRDPRKAGRLAATQALLGCDADPCTLLLFASGPHGAWAGAIAEGAREVAPRATIALISSPRISSADDPEVFVGGVSAIALPVKSEVAIGNGDYSARSLRELGRAIAADRPCPVFLFGRSRPSAVVALDAFSDEANAPQLGGALGVGAGLSAVGADGVVREGTLLALRIEDELSLVDASATSVEPIVPFAPITEVRRGYIERVGSERALDWLRASGGSAPEGSLLLAMLAVGPERRPLVRGIAGVEPSRGAIHVGDDVEEGETIAIGISTGRVPPEAIEGAQRRALRRLSGAAPRAALLVDPVGRGPRAALAQCGFEERFGSIPWVGIRAAAQIVSGAERPRLAQHTATLSLLCSAS